MLFKYKAIDQDNVPREGVVEASDVDSAIQTVQDRGNTVLAIDPVEEKSSILNYDIEWSHSISNKEIVILSRQIATLFEAQVSALRIFRMLGAETDNKQLRKVMNSIADDLQGGSSISRALSAHPDVFSSFYVNMVRSGEETGSLEKSFMYLASYLDRQYQIVSKARNALIYPAFVIVTFFGVMSIMLTMVIPQISEILISSGVDLPIYTRIVVGASDFMVSYIGLILILLAGAGLFVWQFAQTQAGKRSLDELKLSLPYIGDLYHKLYLTRICDNLATMVSSGISMVTAIEVTADVVDNMVYKEILEFTLLEVKGGRSFADSIAEYPEMPGVLAQMAKVGEETGSLPDILTTLSVFYRREVENSVDTLIGLIEPAMILVLGAGVAILLASVLVPIYNLTGAF